MFFIKAAEKEDIVHERLTEETAAPLADAIIAVHNPKSTGSQRDTAFKLIRSKFGGYIFNKVKAIKRDYYGASEMKELKQHVETEFADALMRFKEFSPDDKKLAIVKKFMAYLKGGFERKINVHSGEEALGKGKMIGQQYATRFKNALRDFIAKHKRAPDLFKVVLKAGPNPDPEAEDHIISESKDLEEFAKILKTDEKDVLEILNTLGQSFIKSMSQEVAGDGEDAALLLGDTLKSNEPLPDEVLEDSELMRTLIKEIKKIPQVWVDFKRKDKSKGLPERIDKSKPITQEKIHEKMKEGEDIARVLMEYYHPGKPNAEEPTTNELAAKLKLDERKVRDYIAIGREVLGLSPVLRELYTASMVVKFVKMAMSQHKSTEDLVFEITAQCHQ
jgi:hypothetical protein